MVADDRKAEGTKDAAALEIMDLPTAAGGAIGIARPPGVFGGRYHPERLQDDLDRLAEWGADTILCVMDPAEIEALDRERMQFEIRCRNIGYLNLPIPRGTMPDPAFDAEWESLRSRAVMAVGKGQRLLVQSEDGYERSFVVAARVLIDSGFDVEAAIRALRDLRPGALGAPEQEESIRAYAGRR